MPSEIIVLFPLKNCNTNQGNGHSNNFTDFQWFFSSSVMLESSTCDSMMLMRRMKEEKFQPLPEVAFVTV